MPLPPNSFGNRRMPPPTVGILSFGTPPSEHMLAVRYRAVAAEAALQQLDLVFFSSQDCDLDTGTVLARRVATGTHAIPLPRVVSVINEPLRERDRQVDAYVRARCRVVEGRAPDKAELPRLFAATALEPYLIPARLLTKVGIADDLAAWIQHHGASIVKPADGMRGGGIRLIEPAGEGWRLHYRDEIVEGPLAECIAAIVRGIAGRMGYRRYIVQRAVNSRAEDGRALTLRVDLHRRPDGGWAIVRDVARIAEAGRITSNIASGGYQRSAPGLLSRRRRRPAEELYEELQALAIMTAQHLDRVPEATLTELGVDVLIDDDDRLWLLEANVLPETTTAETERAVHHITYLKALAEAAAQGPG